MSEPRMKRRKVAYSSQENHITDPRFANLQSDPRYRLPSKKHKVKLDNRFSRPLQVDDDFSRRAKVDRYGRPVETDSERQRLKRKYVFEGEGESERSDEADDDEEVQKELKRVQTQPRDVLREGLSGDSSADGNSSSDDDSSDGDVEEDAELAIGTNNDVPTGQVSSRLAVVNLDSDHMRAQDLMAGFSSSGFLPSNARLLNVTIYPSEFGKERMAREEMEGPPPEIFANSNHDNTNAASGFSSDFDEDDDQLKKDILAPDVDTLDFDSTALRNYQLERLRYFYAVLTFSSPTAAKAIYDAVDGTEYQSTANFFDLRFIPDHVSFDDDEARESCSSLPADYRPNEFITDALQHSKVKLTWDAEDLGRKEAQARAFRGGKKELDENDLKAYLGTDSSSASDVDDGDDTAAARKTAEREKMRSLLGLPADPLKSKRVKDDAPVGGVQVTFSAGLSTGANGAAKKSVFENSPEPDETTVERYVRKEKERKQKRKDRMKAQREGIAPPEDSKVPVDNDAPQEQADADLGFDDPFFAEPSHDKSSTTKIRKEQRLKKKQEREEEEAAERKQRAQLELLMGDDGSSENKSGEPRKKGVTHFDMREIEKAEKAKRKEEKRKAAKPSQKSKSKSTGAANIQDQEASAAMDDGGFSLDVSDPRFASIYENHEYAIDPTNPRYSGTKGMETLLEEGRKRKSKKDKKRKEKGVTEGAGGYLDATSNGVQGYREDEVLGLVEKIKKRKA